jgi:LAS superfamily LD-carboxypeptidase LdcB
VRPLLILTLTLGLFGLPLNPARADVSDFPFYTGDDFKEMYDFAVRNELPRLTQPHGRTEVTVNEDLDSRIWAMAFQRGYVLRPVASGVLAIVDGIQMQPEAAAAWKQLKSAARDAGLPFIVLSAYRSPERQRNLFNSKLAGTSDDAINAALRWYSLPGTSKHHSGYALDFIYPDGTFGEFRQTAGYAWLEKDNFYNAKRFGFIPSYPDDVSAQGPNPEPWEFVWVGVEMIRCGTPVEASLIGPMNGPTAQIVADVAECPGLLINPGEVIHGLPLWWYRIS